MSEYGGSSQAGKLPGQAVRTSSDSGHKVGKVGSLGNWGGGRYSGIHLGSYSSGLAGQLSRYPHLPGTYIS